MSIKNAKIQVTSEGALLCPSCRRPFKGIRIQPDAQLSRVCLRCSFCKQTWIVTTESGQSLQARATAHLL